MNIIDSEASNRTVVTKRIINAPIDDVFDAYANPEKIVRWWGASGLTLKNESIDLRKNGHWHFVLQTSDGTEFQNHQVFEKIERPHSFVVNHVSEPVYRGVVTFEEVQAKTRITMYWTFEDKKTFAKIKDGVASGNEGNLDRLEELLRGKR